jgi:hypothetical protein
MSEIRVFHYCNVLINRYFRNMNLVSAYIVYIVMVYMGNLQRALITVLQN